MLGRGRQPRDIHRLDLHLHLRPRHGLAPLTSPPSPHDVLRREPHNAVQMYLRRRPARGTIATLTLSLPSPRSPPPMAFSLLRGEPQNALQLYFCLVSAYTPTPQEPATERAAAVPSPPAACWRAQLRGARDRVRAEPGRGPEGVEPGGTGAGSAGGRGSGEHACTHGRSSGCAPEITVCPSEISPDHISGRNLQAMRSVDLMSPSIPQ